MLAWRGALMLEKVETTWGLILAAALGALVGIAKGNFVLGKTARRNIKRLTHCVRQARVKKADRMQDGMIPDMILF